MINNDCIHQFEFIDNMPGGYEIFKCKKCGFIEYRKVNIETKKSKYPSYNKPTH